MKEKPTVKATLGDVAKAAGISKTSAGCALRNLAGVSEETRLRVQKIARRLDYSPDARLTSRMVGLRQAATRDLIPIAWLNTNEKKDAWREYQFLAPYQEGARVRCKELGYRIEEIWTRQPGLKMRRISQIIDQQGIEGVIVSEPARHVRLNWERLAGVCIGGGLLMPQLHRITTNSVFNTSLTLKMLKRFGYGRIGICITEEADRFSGHEIRSAIYYFNSTIPKSRRIKPLFFPYVIKEGDDKKMVTQWLHQEQPDVIVGHSCHLENWVKDAGYRVPQEVGVVHLAIEDDVLDWAGIYANKREVGRLAADTLISLIQSREFGVPKITSTRLVRGSWRSGRTLLVPKQK
jgi:LacI family transcriptional regulator